MTSLSQTSKNKNRWFLGQDREHQSRVNGRPFWRYLGITIIKVQLVLSKEDKEALTYGRMLNDELINFAQMLLKTQFPVIEGLESTLLQYTDLQKITQEVQIIHSRGNHWVLASTIGCSTTEVNIFMSLLILILSK